MHWMTLNMLGQENQPLWSDMTSTWEGSGTERDDSSETFVGLLTTTRVACQMEVTYLKGSLEDMERIMDQREKVGKSHNESRQCFIGFVRETFIAALIFIRLRAQDIKYRTKAYQCVRMIEKWELEFGEMTNKNN